MADAAVADAAAVDAADTAWKLADAVWNAARKARLDALMEQTNAELRHTRAPGMQALLMNEPLYNKTMIERRKEIDEIDTKIKEAEKVENMTKQAVELKEVYATRLAWLAATRDEMDEINTKIKEVEKVENTTKQAVKLKKTYATRLSWLAATREKWKGWMKMWQKNMLIADDAVTNEIKDVATKRAARAVAARAVADVARKADADAAVKEAADEVAALRAARAARAARVAEATRVDEMW